MKQILFIISYLLICPSLQAMELPQQEEAGISAVEHNALQPISKLPPEMLQLVIATLISKPALVTDEDSHRAIRNVKAFLSTHTAHHDLLDDDQFVAWLINTIAQSRPIFWGFNKDKIDVALEIGNACAQKWLTHYLKSADDEIKNYAAYLCIKLARIGDELINCEKIKFLARAGVPINKHGDGWHQTSLFCAVECARKNIAKLLIELDPQGVNQCDAFERKTVLRMACQSFDNNDVDIIRLLIKTGADVNGLGDYKCCSAALHVCVEKNKPAFIQELLAAGADIYLKYGSLDESALQCAIRREDISSFELFLSAGMDINRTCFEELNITPLTSALRNKASLQFIQFLVEHGADVTHEDFSGFRPSEIARRNQTYDVADYLDAQVRHHQKATPRYKN